MPPLVSVLIPCYRQAHFLADAITSVLAQDYRPFEVVVVDDGSPDDVPAVLAAFPGVRLVRQDNRGLSSARNRGLAESRGEFVVCLDADDRLLPNALSIGVAALLERPRCAFVWGFRQVIDSEGRVLSVKTDTSHHGPVRYDQLLHDNVVGNTLGVLFRRNTLEAVGGFDEEQPFAEDYEIFLRLAREHESWCHRQLVGEYRIHTANMSLNSRGMFEGVMRALDLQERWIGGNGALRSHLEAGRRSAWRNHDCWTRMAELSRHARAKRWGRAAVCSIGLLWKYPARFSPALLRKIRRTVLPSTA